MFVRARTDEPALGEHHRGRPQVVDREPEAADQPAGATALPLLPREALGRSSCGSVSDRVLRGVTAWFERDFQFRGVLSSARQAQTKIPASGWVLAGTAGRRSAPAAPRAPWPIR